ncbi:unnamed protein product [Gongylonema pulchrum]|uniref:Uncharacterized protein n=1 Tax=Gongylonema pulchrum TaxID=637853 RepID=A0A3P7MCW9_9BILA|nr:unnamed protein product [Gongylonema pulchrum]
MMEAGQELMSQGMTTQVGNLLLCVESIPVLIGEVRKRIDRTKSEVVSKACSLSQEKEGGSILLEKQSKMQADEGKKRRIEEAREGSEAEAHKKHKRVEMGRVDSCPAIHDAQPRATEQMVENVRYLTPNFMKFVSKEIRRSAKNEVGKELAKIRNTLSTFLSFPVSSRIVALSLQIVMSLIFRHISHIPVVQAGDAKRSDLERKKKRQEEARRIREEMIAKTEALNRMLETPQSVTDKVSFECIVMPNSPDDDTEPDGAISAEALMEECENELSNSSALPSFPVRLDNFRSF